MKPNPVRRRRAHDVVPPIAGTRTRDTECPTPNGARNISAAPAPPRKRGSRACPWPHRGQLLRPRAAATYGRHHRAFIGIDPGNRNAWVAFEKFAHSVMAEL